jgi:hypothetical protein
VKRPRATAERSARADRRAGLGRRLVLAIVLAAVVALLAARRADAGEYVVAQCSSINSSAEASWEGSTDNYRGRWLCGSDSGLQVFHDAAESGLWHYGAWVWRAPAGTVFTNVQANASLTNQAGHRGQLAVVRPSGELVEFGSEHNDFRVNAIAGAFSQFHAWLRCVAPGPGRPCGRAGFDGGHAYVRGVFLRTEDRVPPTLRLEGGSLLADPVVRGVRGLVFSAADTGSGISRVYVAANGAPLVTDVRNCAVVDGFATTLSPCPATTLESAAVPTAHPALATGPNTVTACVQDLALDGHPHRACTRISIWVDNACPGSAISGGRSLSAAFEDGGLETTVRSDRSAVVRGRIGGAGAGATVCALTRTQIAGAPIVVGATVTTGADGAFALELPPGAARSVFIHHAVGDRVLVRHGLRLRSIVRPTLAVRPNHGVRRGDRLYFSGTLPGPACTGRVVKIQARIGRRRWQVFRTDRADASCVFNARYKLRATRRARRYRFRSLVPQQAGYPYERGYSRTTKVKLKRRRGGR